MKLHYPLTFGKKQITELTFRDYTTAEDYLSFDQRGGVAQRIALIASLTGTDEALVKRLRGPDYVRAEQLASDMLSADALEAEQNNTDRIALLARLTGLNANSIADVLNLPAPDGEFMSDQEAFQKKSLESSPPSD